MAQIQHNVDLSPFNTFKVSAHTKALVTLNSSNSMGDFNFQDDSKEILILGEGANILFTHDFPGLVIKNEIKSKKIIGENEKTVSVEMGAGENWHDFVMWSVENNLSGIENLALIPGTVGAAPVQNLAAYGQNVGEVIESVYGHNLDRSEWQRLSYNDCKLYYRDSVFKHELKNKFFITLVTFKLFKTAHFDTNYHSRYESLKSELGEPPYTPKQIAQAVIALRQKKLPDWKVFGTAGSFFANPFVTKTKFDELSKSIKELQAYPVDNMLYPNPDDPVLKLTDQVKIPAGRLLDELGWKGKRIGNVGTFEKHALVVVNYGGATGREILEFTQKMQEDVKKHFDINLEPEVNII